MPQSTETQWKKSEMFGPYVTDKYASALAKTLGSKLVKINPLFDSFSSIEISICSQFLFWEQYHVA